MAAQETTTMTQAQVMDFISGLAASAGLEIKFAQEPEKIPETQKKHKGRKLPKVLSPKMIEALFEPINLKCKTGLRNRVAFEVMLNAGLRVAEVCDLQKSSIDFEENMIHVQNGKGGTDRNIPIGSASCLREWLQKWDEKRPQESRFFFCSLKGTQLIPRYFNTVLHRLSEKTGVYLQDDLEQIPVSNHKLRHTCATTWLKNGFSLPEIQRLLGHKSINTTMIYLDVSMDDIRAKIDALG